MNLAGRYAQCIRAIHCLQRLRFAGDQAAWARPARMTLEEVSPARHALIKRLLADCQRQLRRSRGVMHLTGMATLSVLGKTEADIHNVEYDCDTFVPIEGSELVEPSWTIRVVRMFGYGEFDWYQEEACVLAEGFSDPDAIRLVERTVHRIGGSRAE